MPNDIKTFRLRDPNEPPVAGTYDARVWMVCDETEHETCSVHAEWVERTDGTGPFVPVSGASAPIVVPEPQLCISLAILIPALVILYRITRRG